MIDYTENFSLVLKMTSLQILLAMATLLDYHVHQMDVLIAFLNGLLKEAIYINQPEGYIQCGHEHKVCRLLDSLYRLKQSAREWYEILDSFVINNGFIKYKSDNNVYIKRSASFIIIIGIYIDDLIIISNGLQYLGLHKILLTPN
jgi:hypothetical protein